MADRKANDSITRQTERLRQMRSAEDRRVAAAGAAYARETQGFVDAAAQLDGGAVEHLRNRGHTWDHIAQATGRTVDELQAAYRTMKR